MAYLGVVQRQEHASAKEQTPVLPQLLFNPTKYFPICPNSLDGIKVILPHTLKRGGEETKILGLISPLKFAYLVLGLL